MVSYKYIDTGIKQISKLSSSKLPKLSTTVTKPLTFITSNNLERVPVSDCFTFIEHSIKALPNKFVPAKTIEEAQNFGRRFLGIKSYTGFEDIEMINYVNEGLFNVSKATNGKAVMPHYVTYKTRPNTLSPMSVRTPKNGERYLEINTDFFNLLDKHLEDQYKKMVNSGLIIKQNDKYVLKSIFRCGEKAHKLEESINKFLLGNEKLSLKEKMSLSIFSDNIVSFSTNHIKTKAPHVAIRNICDGLGKDSFILNGKQYTLSDVEKMDIVQQREILKGLIDNGKHYDFIQSPTCYIAHESVHLLHSDLLGHKKFSELTDTSFLSARNEQLSRKQGIDPNEARKNMQNFLQEEKQSIASEVSDYAKTNPLEFVAEVYSRLIEGRTFSKKVMDMYKFYGGPII